MLTTCGSNMAASVLCKNGGWTDFTLFEPEVSHIFIGDVTLTRSSFYI